MDATAEAEERVRRAKHNLRQAEEALHALKCKKAGIRIGDVVLYKGKQHKVVSIDTTWRKPWLTGHPQLANGEFGKAIRNLYGDWEHVAHA